MHFLPPPLVFRPNNKAISSFGCCSHPPHNESTLNGRIGSCFLLAGFLTDNMHDSMDFFHSSYCHYRTRTIQKGRNIFAFGVMDGVFFVSKNLDNNDLRCQGCNTQNSSRDTCRWFLCRRCGRSLLIWPFNLNLALGFLRDMMFEVVL